MTLVRRALAITLTWLLSCVASQGALSSQENSFTDSDLNKLLPYVRWPEALFSRRGLTVCVTGKTRMPEAEGSTRKFQIKALGDVSDDTQMVPVSGCDILLVTRLQERRLGKLLAEIREPVLTVSEQEHFIQLGGMIQVRNIDTEKKEFLINLDRVRTAGLDIDSALLALSIVHVVEQGR